MNPQWICVKRSYILDCKNMNWKFDPESPSSVQGLKHVHLQISQKIALFCSQVWKASCKEGCNFTIPTEIYWELIWGNKFCWHSPCHRLPLHANARCPSINPRHIPRKKKYMGMKQSPLRQFLSYTIISSKSMVSVMVLKQIKTCNQSRWHLRTFLQG